VKDANHHGSHCPELSASFQEPTWAAQVPNSNSPSTPKHSIAHLIHTLFSYSCITLPLPSSAYPSHSFDQEATFHDNPLFGSGCPFVHSLVLRPHLTTLVINDLRLLIISHIVCTYWALLSNSSSQISDCIRPQQSLLRLQCPCKPAPLIQQ
jgi:hypothetical protein